jgi:LPXTG-motif cell wall-anchored protein
MKLRTKVFAGFIVIVLLLSLTVGTALAATELPVAYDEAAGGAALLPQTDNNDVWIKITGSGVTYGNQEIAEKTRSVDITITGNATFDVQFIYNSNAGWLSQDYPGQSVEGEKVFNYAMNGSGTQWCEAVINLRNKSEGPLEVTRMEFKDEAGEVILTVGEPASDAAPKTGVVSTALFLGLGAAVLGTGAVVLKKKED